MAHLSTWNSAYELVPAQADAPSTLGTTGRATRVDIRERMENEHSSYTTKGGTSGGSVAADFLHKAGSGRVYYQASAPTLRPDGVTALSAADAGREWVETTYLSRRTWSGSAWVATTAPIGMCYIQFPGAYAPSTIFGGTWSNISSSYAGDFFRAEGGNARAFESGEQTGSTILLREGYIAATAVDPSSAYDTFAASGVNVYYNSTVTGAVPSYRYLFRPVNRTVRIWKRTA